jgi:hypothetical protein
MQTVMNEHIEEISITAHQGATIITDPQRGDTEEQVIMNGG